MKGSYDGLVNHKTDSDFMMRRAAALKAEANKMN